MSFSEILGQETAKRYLRQVTASGKIPHAYLFTGIVGIGKASTAKAFAMALNCNEPIDLEACGQCSSCRKFKSGNFPDFISIQPEGQNIRIQQIKDLNRSLSFAPAAGGYRVCVIHQTETMNDASANAFLKTLEEPPPRNLLILKVAEPLDLLPTIVSRCQKVPFHPLNGQDIEAWLLEKREVDRETAILLSRICAGSLGLAVKMIESDFMAKRKAWLSKLINLPDFSRDAALDMALECADEDRKKGLDVPVSGEVGMQDMLTVWSNWYRDMLLLRVDGPPDLLMNIDFSNELKNIAGSYSINSLVDCIMAVDRAQLDIHRMRNATLVMEHTVLNLNRLAENRH